MLTYNLQSIIPIAEYHNGICSQIMAIEAFPAETHGGPWVDLRGNTDRLRNGRS